MKERMVKWDRTDKAVLTVLLLIFLSLPFVFGIGRYPDTESYLLRSLTREPVYALLLNAAVLVFGEAGYFLLGIAQNLLAAGVVFLMVRYLRSAFPIRSRLLVWAVCLCMLMPYVVTPFFASSRLVISNAMLSEGIAVSVYNLYLFFLLHAVWEKEKRTRFLVCALLTGLLLSLTRNQLLVTLVAWLVTSVILSRNAKKAVVCALLFAAALAGRSVLAGTYNLFANGCYTGTTYGPVTILSNVIYVAQREDGEAIADERLRKLYYDVYDFADREGMLYGDAPESFSEEAVFYSEMHDAIKYEAFVPLAEQYVLERYGVEEYAPRALSVDEAASQIMKPLLKQCFGPWAAHYFKNAAAGLIRTAAFVHPLLNIPALLGYAVLIFLGVYNWKRNHDSKSVKLLLLTALLTAGNVAAVSLTIMCLSRYMIYNTSALYVTAVLLLTEACSYKEEGNGI